MTTADQDLLRQWLQEKDAEAFREVALRYAGMVYGICRRILHNTADAEDAAQETFTRLAALTKPDVNVGPWLHRVAVNCALVQLRSQRRRHKRERAFTEAAAVPDAPMPADVLARLDEAVAALPPKFREPLVCHFYNGQTHEAIAEQLHVSRQAVGYRIQKAIDQVRAEMKKQGILVAAATLATVLTQDMAEASPATVTTHIGKLAVLGHSSSGSAVAALSASAGKSLFLKVVVAIAVLTLAAVYGLTGWSNQAPAVIPAAAITPPVEVRTAPDLAENHAQATAPQPSNAESAPVLAAPDDTRGDSTLLIGTFYSSGEPAQGANVQLCRAANLRTHEPPLRVRNAVADARGMCVFEDIPNGEYAFTARSQRENQDLFAICLITIDLPRTSYYKGHLILYPVVTTQGTVRDEQGKPVANAVLYPNHIAATPELVMKLSHRAVSGNVDTDVRTARALATAVVTDSAGRFSIGMWPETLVEFLLVSSGYRAQLTQFIPAGGAPEITVAKGTQLTGTISIADTGLPLADADVVIESVEENLDRRLVSTDSNGQFTVEGLSSGEYCIVVDHPDFALDPDDQPFVVAGEKAMQLVLLAQKSGSICGSVVDEETGKGIADATVKCGNGLKYAESVTDRNGAFCFSGLCGNVSLFATPDPARDQLDKTLQVEVNPAEEKAGILIEGKMADPRVRVSGKTVDEKRNSLSGVYVTAQDPDKGFCKVTRSGPGGMFSVEGLPVTSNLAIFASKPGLASVPLTGLTVDANALDNVELKLLPTGSISGVLVDTSGKPYSAVDWRIASNIVHTVGSAWLPSESVPVMPSGVFRFFDLPVGEHNLFVDTEAYTHNVTTGQWAPPATINLKADQEVTGIKLPCNQDGAKPRADIAHAQPPADTEPKWMVRGVVLGPDGTPVSLMRCKHGLSTSMPDDANFWWQGSEPSISIQFEAKGCLPLTREFHRSEARDGTLNCDIQMQPGCVVEGYVRNQRGEPLSGASVHIGKVWRGIDPFLTEVVETNADGKYRVDTLPAGPVLLFAEHPSFARGSTSVSPVQSKVTLADIALSDGGTLEGYVYSAGKPVPDVMVQYGNDDEPSMFSITTADAAGFYRMPHVPLGPIKVIARLDMERSIERQIEIEEGQVIPLDFHFGALTARAEGNVTLNGYPAPSVSVTCICRTGDSVETTYSSQSNEGTYEVVSVPAGEAELRVIVSLEGQSLHRVLQVTLTENQAVRQDVEFTGTGAITGNLSGVTGVTDVLLFEGSSLKSPRDTTTSTPSPRSTAAPAGGFWPTTVPAAAVSL